MIVKLYILFLICWGISAFLAIKKIQQFGYLVCGDFG